MLSTRLVQQMQFVIEVDKLKQVLRQTLLTNGSRRENSAEHSWHIALMAIVLAEYAPAPIDILHVIKLLLLHDLVEIDAGDTFCYDEQGNQSKADRETQAADRLFGLLPPDQALEFRQLWDEFETQATPAAGFAAAVDRLQPLLNNQQTGGHTWKLHDVTSDRVLQRMAPIQTSAPELWAVVQQVIDDCIAAGYLKEPVTEEVAIGDLNASVP
ncbi:HD domain-containing protein [Stenomitos frigidus]|uniref:Phosphohydrolase n=1 Tax=Stenomitos frigidus ULC18 TaxID=2107698 RepID=A0A2T1EDI5_9CYAN|nr:HD domain-containing protein [Stenomitos frigidus]PSB30800.1 phosphohydrolase [Stenomitos frigidus ULC18]